MDEETSRKQACLSRASFSNQSSLFAIINTTLEPGEQESDEYAKQTKIPGTTCSKLDLNSLKYRQRKKRPVNANRWECSVRKFMLCYLKSFCNAMRRGLLQLGHPLEYYYTEN